MVASDIAETEYTWPGICRADLQTRMQPRKADQEGRRQTQMQTRNAEQEEARTYLGSALSRRDWSGTEAPTGSGARHTTNNHARIQRSHHCGALCRVNRRAGNEQTPSGMLNSKHRNLASLSLERHILHSSSSPPHLVHPDFLRLRPPRTMRPGRRGRVRNCCIEARGGIVGKLLPALDCAATATDATALCGPLSPSSASVLRLRCPSSSSEAWHRSMA